MKQRLDETDRRIIAALREDGRASIANLSVGLSLARGTVRTRMERMVATGVIRRFTVELAVESEPDMVRAVMSIELKGATSRSVVQRLAKIPEVTAIHSTNGAWDLVAEIRAASLPNFDGVLAEVRSIAGVSNSETSLLLDTF